MDIKKRMQKEHKTDGTPCWCNPKIVDYSKTKCGICGKSFKKKQKTEKYCSTKCAYKAMDKKKSIDFPENDATDQLVLISPIALSIFASNRTPDECRKFIKKHKKQI